MKKQILSIGRVLSKKEQLVINGGDAGACRDAYPAQGNGCKCRENNQCALGYCQAKAGSNWWKGECASKPALTVV